ncbi:MAG: aminopeptidase P family N-terminal domain-containing protein, partial [Eggerthellaceae bacterium]|nr:aminopeptidase P family N-terminal domain-containing protein [Eggerthellaceae bacterium]
MEKPELDTPQEIIQKHAEDTCTKRIEKLREELKKEELNAFVLRDTSNIAWLTAFDKVFDEEVAHALYIDEDHAILHTDSRYAEACRRAALRTQLEIADSTLKHAKFTRKENEQTLHAQPGAV